MTNKEHISKIAEFEKEKRFNEDINPVDWNDCYPVTENFPYIQKNIFKKFINYFKKLLIINPFSRKQNKKIFKTIVVGRENIDKVRGGIVTSNHFNIFDCLAIRYALKDNNLKYCVAEFNNRKGFLGNMMRAVGIMPLSAKFTIQKNFSKGISHHLSKGQSQVPSSSLRP